VLISGSHDKSLEGGKLIHLTKRELFDLLEILNQSLTVRTESDLKSLLLRVRRLVPSVHIIAALGRMSPSGQYQDLVKIINVSYPDDWTSLYLERGYGAVDPVLKAHFKHYKTQLWSDTFQRPTSRREKEFIGQATEFGLRQGVTLGILSRPQCVGSLFSFSGDSMGDHSRYAAVLEYLLPHLHLALTGAAGSSLNEAPLLSAREREVLEWMKEGKTNWEISHILNISERTVKFHVQNILSKLQASTRGHAIALAMRHRLIEP